MPPDRLLTTVLSAIQGHPSDPEQINRIFSTTTSLLTTLSNPRNITLLTSQFLIAPAIWTQPSGLATSFRIISIFNTAAITLRKNQLESPKGPYDAYQPRRGGGIHCDEWAKTVIAGADEKSSRWQHLLVLAGVLLGMEGQDRRGLSRGLRTTLEEAIVTAANLALDAPEIGGLLGVESIVLALNHVFPLLSDSARSDLNYDALLMIMGRAITSKEGYEDGYFLENINFNVRELPGNKFDWSESSPSYIHLQEIVSKPLVSSVGPLSRLIAHAVENVRNPARVLELQEHILHFTGNIFDSWQRNKLSEIDPSEEALHLTLETLQVTFPLLWQVLKTTMFSIVVILQAIVGRTLLDPFLSNKHGSKIASKTIIVLRNIYFISSRLGPNAFSAYTFVNLTSIDILTRNPAESRSLLQTILPKSSGQIPMYPLYRNLDLFYLNTCEHFTLILSSYDNEALVVTPASPYLNPTATGPLKDIFEAAHSAMLAALAAPQAVELNAKILPFYVDSLFQSFPKNLTSRQFRFAFKTLIQITTPPAPLSASQPILAETLLELLHHRALGAQTIPMTADSVGLSEQAVLLLTLLDALPNLPLPLLKEWLPLSADLLNTIEEGMREVCKARFWEVLESGEMDVERSAICVAWWGTRGGRDRILYTGIPLSYPK